MHSMRTSVSVDRLHAVCPRCVVHPPTGLSVSPRAPPTAPVTRRVATNALSVGFQQATSVNDCPFTGVTYDGLYIPPLFLEKLSMHVTKNILHNNSSMPTVQVPVILGIWGPNGNGKTFQTQLVYKLLGIDAKTITAEQLFASDGARAANLILDSYFAASDAISQGKMSALYISDLDASGLAESDQRYQQCAAIAATLMDIADNPEDVQGVRCNRVPIVSTGNNFRTFYGPLISKGRFEKFLWEPTWNDKVGTVQCLCPPLGRDGAAQVVDAFPEATVEFLSSLVIRTAETDTPPEPQAMIALGDSMRY